MNKIHCPRTKVVIRQETTIVKCAALLVWDYRHVRIYCDRDVIMQKYPAPLTIDALLDHSQKASFLFKLGEIVLGLQT